MKHNFWLLDFDIWIKSCTFAGKRDENGQARFDIIRQSRQGKAA